MSSERGGPSANFLTGEFEAQMRNHRVPTTDDRRHAALVVADYATDADDCRTLLAMLGLDPHERTGGSA